MCIKTWLIRQLIEILCLTVNYSLFTFPVKTILACFHGLNYSHAVHSNVFILIHTHGKKNPKARSCVLVTCVNIFDI